MSCRSKPSGRGRLTAYRVSLPQHQDACSYPPYLLVRIDVRPYPYGMNSSGKATCSRDSGPEGEGGGLWGVCGPGMQGSCPAAAAMDRAAGLWLASHTLLRLADSSPE